ncbi:PepSY domain-containing protein [Mucilaginibacter antarcticus]|uniref:PepSY domain-containing protein n=1 Tax=Mucilaginibacter antarcticus TaxID=1855725 RepID=UPI00362B5862
MADTTFNLNDMVTATANKWQRSDITLVAIRNYGDKNMHVVIQGKPHTDAQMNGVGELIYRVRDNKILSERSPLSEPTYTATVTGILYHLHFGDYGGRPIKVIYFVLGIMGCIVINSGVMIWLVARDKKSIPERKRKFNFWTANIYLATSLSLLPVTGITMISLLFIDKPGQPDIYHWFFYSWLGLSVYFMALRNLDRVNRHSTFLSTVICFALPILDGVVRGNCFWETYKRGAFDILFIDVLFLSLAIISAIILWKIKTKPQMDATASAPKVKAKSKARELATAE